MSMITMGPWSKVKGGRPARGGGRARIREGRGGENWLNRHYLPFPSPSVIVWLGWDEVSSGGRRIIPTPYHVHIIWVFNNNDNKADRNLFNRNWRERKLMGFMLCWKWALSPAGCSFSAGNKIRKEEEQEGLKEKHGTNNHLENMCERDEWIHKMNYLRGE